MGTESFTWNSPSGAAGISAIAGGVSAIGSAWASSSAYKVKEIETEMAARAAKLQGAADILSLQQNFNKTMASNAVMGAAQGRRGGSVDAVASAAEAKFNWDSDFTEISANIRANGYDAQAAQYDIAASQAFIGGSISAISGSALDMAEDLYSIGSSSKEN